jgi:hypothetical protein
MTGAWFTPTDLDLLITPIASSISSSEDDANANANHEVTTRLNKAQGAAPTCRHILFWRV